MAMKCYTRYGRRSMDNAALIEAQEASLVYHDGDREVRAVDAVSLQVRPSEFVGIVGPSGSGKSSLLYLLSGLKLPTRGSVRYHGQCYTDASDAERSAMRRERFGFVFQQPYLLGYLTVLENVVVGAPDVGQYRKRALWLLEQLGLVDKAHRYPSALSGGERQRACVARALLMEPEVIFADEPTAALDQQTGLHVLDLLEQHRGSGAVVLVTHDPLMLRYCDTVYKLRSGRVESVEQAQGKPVAHPSAPPPTP
ncbi:MAG: ABC transporter ATP-binding protein [Fimbriimonadales bacterium]|nr:MAG: ABC transporter ATP-binding protein [Fimbriimonadales bacterium]